MRSIARHTLALGIAATLLGAGADTMAHAATYEVRACRDAPDGAAAAFTAINSHPETVTTRLECPPDPGDSYSGLLAAAILGAPNSPSGASAGWTVAAPSGTTLQRLTVKRYLGKRDHDWDVAVRAADGRALDTCDFDPTVQLGCTVGSSTPTSLENTATYADLATQRVTFAVTCNAGPFTCANGATQRQAWIAVYGAVATVEDPAPPTFGALTGPDTDGWHRGGAEQATISANDNSGIKSTSLLLDGQPLVASQQTCNYTNMRPCPPSATTTFPIDLGQIPDGTHELRFAATDAADQQQSSPPRALRIDQHAPTAPQQLTAQRNADGTYTARWQNVDQGSAAPIIAAHYAVCRTAAPASCPTGETISGPNITSIPTVHVPAGDRYDVRVWLQDEANNSDPAQAATVAVDTTKTPTTTPPGTNNPGARPLGGGKATRSSKLRPTRAARRGATLTITGTIAPNATATVSATLARTRTGRRLLTAETKARRGRWTLRIHLTPAQRRNPPRFLTLRYAGDRRHMQAKLVRRLITKPLKKAALAPKSALREFDFERIKSK